MCSRQTRHSPINYANRLIGSPITSQSTVLVVAQLSVLMAGLRGSTIDRSDFADNDVVMQLISVSDSDGESLPLSYDPVMIAEYWGRRPVSVLTRLAQLGGGRPP